ncbi:MAG: pentapeptide repeat-containing protein, partial [Candidatus Rokuibacteriota bacterium]
MPAQPGAPANGVDTVNDAIRSIGTVAVTFTLTILYLGITAASTTHAQLLRGRDLELPLLDVEVPVFDFFRFAPLMLVALHLVFLLQVLFVYRRLRGLGDLDGRQDLVAPSIFSEAGLPRERTSLLVLLVRLVVLAILLVPLVLLAVMQGKFLPYHEPEITRWFHQVPALIDLLLCGWLVPLILSRDGTWRGFRTPRPQAGCAYVVLTRTVFVLILLAFLLFSWVVAVVPSEGEQDHRTGLAWALGLRRNLDVSGQRLVDPESWRPTPGVAPRHATLNLSGRDLRGADFSHAILPGVDFRGADLRNARFAGADLRGSDFSPGIVDGPDAAPRATDLTNADFAGAVLD